MPAMEPASLLRFLRKLKEVFDVCDEDADGFIRVEHFVALGLQFGQGDEVSAATPAPARPSRPPRPPRNFHLLRPPCGERATALLEETPPGPPGPRVTHLASSRPGLPPSLRGVPEHPPSLGAARPPGLAWLSSLSARIACPALSRWCSGVALPFGQVCLWW